MIMNTGCATNFSGSTGNSGNKTPYVAKKKILGQDRIIAFIYCGDAEKFKSLTVTDNGDWKFWKERGVTVISEHGWFNLLEDTTVDSAVNVLAHLNFGDNPNPVVSIDEFGFDVGGQTDQKCAEILKAAKKKIPGLSIAVCHMMGSPINEVLADAYRSSADIIFLECYLTGEKDYWKLAGMVHAAQMHGLMDKCVLILGVGTGGQPGENWAKTKKDLEEQIRFARLMAPESRGISFFNMSMKSVPNVPDFFSYADKLCGRYFQIPADGRGLPGNVMDIYRTFTKEYKQPALVYSQRWVALDLSRENPNNIVHPASFRAYFMNLGKQDAKNVKIRLRNTPETGNDIFAEGTIDTIPAGGEGIAVLSLTKPETPTPWKEWRTWQIEVDAPGCELIEFKQAPVKP
jgi:hypothetical protein